MLFRKFVYSTADGILDGIIEMPTGPQNPSDMAEYF